MNIQKQPTSVSITFSPKDYWLKESDDEHKGTHMLSHRIDMSYADKGDQEGMPVFYFSEQEAQTFREAGFDELM